MHHRSGVFSFALLIASFGLVGCTGLVAGNNGNPSPPPTLIITNVQTGSITTASSQVIWTTNIAANSSVDYGTTTSYGSSTPVDSAMVTSHQVTLSGLAAGTTYYYQVNSTDSKGNHGHGGNKFNTGGFSLSGTINPTVAGNGATVALSGGASASATADNAGNYTFAGLPNGSYMVTPKHTGYAFTPGSQSATVNGANITGVNFTANAAPVAPAITTQPTNQTVTAGQTATFAVVASGTAPLSYQWNKNGTAVSGATSSSYTTPATTSSDNGAQLTVVVTNTAGSATSSAATLTVNAAPVAPSITTQPASQTVTTGQGATFTVTAAGTAPLSYQWRKNGAAISGATLSSYSTPATTNADNGAQFTVVVTNTAGSVTSSPATLTVSAPALQITASSLPGGHIQTVYSSTLQATGGTAPYTWSLFSGLLPNGLTLSSNGTISGTPTLVGLFTFVIQVRDNAGATASSTLSIDITALGPTVAFPGAQGGGALSVGGRGGAVFLVSNTADSGVGSLRACIDASGPRTCIFRTGGTIAQLNSLTVVNPFLTIAGQTAPGGGIQISGPSGANAPGNPALLVRTHDVVIRYLRVRRGHNAGEVCNQNPWSCGASVEVLSNSASDDPYNIVFDHVSSEWSNYDAMIILGSSTTPNPRSVTVSYSIIGEALAGAGQTVGANFGGYSGAGSTAPDGMTDLDVHHNLFAGTSHRMPLMTMISGRLVNNMVYAWTYYPTRSKGLRDFINNYYKTRSVQAGPSHEIQAWTTNDGNDTSLPPSFYVIGNVGPSDPAGTSNWNNMTALTVNESGSEASNPLSTAYQRSSPIPTPAGYIPIIPDPVSTISSATGYLLNTARTAPYDGVGASRSLDCLGKWVDAQDPVDSRIVNAVANGTTLFGSYDYSSLSASPQTQADLGGWPTLAAGTACVDINNNGLPDVWEAYWGGVFGLGSILDPNGFNFGDGYTNLEHYIDGVSPAP